MDCKQVLEYRNLGGHNLAENNKTDHVHRQTVAYGPTANSFEHNIVVVMNTLAPGDDVLLKSEIDEMVENSVRKVEIKPTIDDGWTEDCVGKLKTSDESLMAGSDVVEVVDSIRELSPSNDVSGVPVGCKATTDSDTKVEVQTTPVDTQSNSAECIRISSKIFYWEKCTKDLRNEKETAKTVSKPKDNGCDPVNLTKIDVHKNDVNRPPIETLMSKSHIERNIPRKTFTVVDTKKKRPIAITRYLKMNENVASNNFCDVESIKQEKSNVLEYIQISKKIFYWEKYMKALSDKKETPEKLSIDVRPVVAIQNKPKIPAKDVNETLIETELPKSQKCDVPQKVLALIDIEKKQPIEFIQNIKTNENTNFKNACDIKLIKQDGILMTNTVINTTTIDDYLFALRDPISDLKEDIPFVKKPIVGIINAEIPNDEEKPFVEILVREIPVKEMCIPKAVVSAGCIDKSVALINVLDERVELKMKRVELNGNPPNKRCMQKRSAHSKYVPIDPLPENSPIHSYLIEVAELFGQIFLKEVMYPLCFELMLNLLKW